MKALPGNDEDEGGEEDESDGFLWTTFFFSLLLCFLLWVLFFFGFFVPLFSAPFLFGPLLLAIHWLFIGCHAAYLPRIMIRHGDIVFQSD
jgi:hypothetical protein